ncbi:XRE family transcriptional regulator [Edaphovirga cremea]|uniref:XRE family transcriptional regulator n=1 Tax=Edaphovirga cremea TaxID=2267246 RepID=UPI003989EC78
MEQYSPAWFKAEMKRKGWSRRDLALRWGKTETWISKITNNPQRDQYWNDAIVGLPDKRKDEL